MTYAQFKDSVLGKKIGDGQCVALVVNNPLSYAEQLFPGVDWSVIFPPVSGAKQLFNDANPKYFEKIANDHNNPNQLPQQGDVLVFDATPQAGFTNTFNNPYGHTGVCDSASTSGYGLLQQNAPYEGEAVNVTQYSWKYRPCIGWLRPVPQKTSNPDITLEQLNQVYEELLHRAPDQAGINHYVGHYTVDFVTNDIKNSNEYKALNAPKPQPAPEPTPQPEPTPPQPAQSPVQSPSTPAETTPSSVPAPAPEPVQTPVPVPEPVQSPTPAPAPVQAPVVVETRVSWWQAVIDFFKHLF